MHETLDRNLELLNTLDAGDVWLSSLEAAPPGGGPASYEPVSLEEIEKRHILRTLEHTDWNKSQAAGILESSEGLAAVS